MVGVLGGLAGALMLLAASIVAARQLDVPRHAAVAAAPATAAGHGIAADETTAAGGSASPAAGGARVAAVASPTTGLSAPPNTAPPVPVVPVFGQDNPVWPAAPYVGTVVVRVTVSSTHPQAGSSIVVTISGVAPGQPIEVVVVNDGQTFPLGALHPGANGAIGQSFTVPLVAGASALKILDPTVGASSSIAMDVIAQPMLAAASGAPSPGSSSDSAGSSRPDESTSDGGIDATEVTAEAGAASVRPSGWGWADTGVALVTVLLFGLPLSGLALLFLGRHDRPYRRR